MKAQQKAEILTSRNAISLLLICKKDRSTVFGKPAPNHHLFVNRVLEDIIRHEQSSLPLEARKSQPPVEQAVKSASSLVKARAPSAVLGPVTKEFRSIIHSASVPVIESYIKSHPEDGKYLAVPPLSWALKLPHIRKEQTLIILEAMAFDPGLEESESTLARHFVADAIDGYIDRVIEDKLKAISQKIDSAVASGDARFAETSSSLAKAASMTDAARDRQWVSENCGTPGERQPGELKARALLPKTGKASGTGIIAQSQRGAIMQSQRAGENLKEIVADNAYWIEFFNLTEYWDKLTRNAIEGLRAEFKRISQQLADNLEALVRSVVRLQP